MEAQKTVENNMDDILDRSLYLNWFGVYDTYGKLLKRPLDENSCLDEGDFDQDLVDAQEYWDELNKAVVFPDFYHDDQIGIVSLLRNDKLGITLTVLNIEDYRNVKFIEADSLRELLEKFPELKQYINKKTIEKI